MRDLAGRIAICTMLLFIIVEHDAVAADQSSPGPGNPAAIALSAKSPLVRSAKEFLLHEGGGAKKMSEKSMRKTQSETPLPHPPDACCLRPLA
jgi:hypothetical protein